MHPLFPKRPEAGEQRFDPEPGEERFDPEHRGEERFEPERVANVEPCQEPKQDACSWAPW